MNKTRITIGVGCGLRKDGSRISTADRAVMISKAKRLLLDRCDGYTMTQADGGWRDETGKDWEEPSLGFVTVADWSEIPARTPAQMLAEDIRNIFDQICVMLTTEPVNTRFV